MASRQFCEREQLVNVFATEQLIYQTPGGNVALVQKCVAVNTNTTAACRVHVWIDPDGGSSVAPGDASHFQVLKAVGAGETVDLGVAGTTIPAGGQLYAAADNGAGGNFQSACNIHISGVLITQSLSGTGTSAA